ncbi:MAG: N-methylhydantoinase [Acidobacteriota bacterium]|nr:N-methylhydantoinase [Acidobacteriota bacterium]
MTVRAHFSIGVDIGGTFTDCVIRDRDGRFVLDKAFTTPGDLQEGVISSVRNACAQWGLGLDETLEQTEVFKAGTTSPVNRLINRAGARTALLTTAGHEDAVIIGRVQQKTDGLSDADRNDLRNWGKAEPLIPRSLIYGLNERVDCFGNVLSPIDPLQIETVVGHCLENEVEAFAVCLLWSFMNPSHELAVREVVERVAPQHFTVLSSEICPIIGEYERATTTMLNTYLGPGTAADLLSLEASLKDRGLRSEVYVMQSSGGVISAPKAVSRPVYLLGSGPVGGVAASRHLSQEVEGQNVIATDMGGTSFDVGVVSNGKPFEVQVSIHERYRVLVPAVEVTSIGAGGGSIARLDPVTGVLQVGPQSAGSVPGPICYGFGGTQPTVTDANAVLRRLNPEMFFAGRHSLNVEAARQAIATEIADPLGVSPEAAAMAIVSIVDSRMADLIRTLTVERGLDPRDFVIVAYGGGGPLHVGSYASQIGCPTAIIPRAAPVYSAWGITNSPRLQTHAASVTTVLPAPTSAIRSVFDGLTSREVADHTEGNNPDSERSESFIVDMRYRYQLQQLAVGVSREELASDDLADLLMERFERQYEDRFGAGTTFRGAGIEISSYRLVISHEFVREADLVSPAESLELLREKREVWFDDSLRLVPVYDADAAATGFRADGPCMLEGRLMTAVIHPGQSVEVDPRGDFLLRLQA